MPSPIRACDARNMGSVAPCDASSLPLKPFYPGLASARTIGLFPGPIDILTGNTSCPQPKERRNSPNFSRVDHWWTLPRFCLFQVL